MKKIILNTKIKFLIILALLWPISVVAQERVEFYNGVRYLGMGNASIAVANDETALIVNPAGLGKLRDIYGTYLDPEIEFGSGTQEVYKAKAFTQPFTFDAVIPSVVASPGSYYHFRGQIMPSFVAKNFGIALLAKYDFNAEANAAGTSVDAFYRDDMALLLGYNLRLFDGRIKIGFTGKLISRIEIDEAALNPNGALDMASLGTAGTAKEGVGVGVDVGLILAAPWTYIPTITAVARDVGGTKFDKSYGNRLSSSTQRPNEQVQDIDVGVALFPIHTNYTRSAWTIEYRGLISGANETDKNKLIHGGVEFNFGDVLFLRAGYNQRYWTAGAEIASESFQFQLASYGEEIGSSATATREDRRSVLKFSFRF